jgi:hypothetical protein
MMKVGDAPASTSTSTARGNVSGAVREQQLHEPGGIVVVHTANSDAMDPR